MMLQRQNSIFSLTTEPVKEIKIGLNNATLYIVEVYFVNGTIRTGLQYERKSDAWKALHDESAFYKVPCICPDCKSKPKMLERIEKIKNSDGHIIDELCPICGNHLASNNIMKWCSYVKCNYWLDTNRLTLGEH